MSSHPPVQSFDSGPTFTKPHRGGTVLTLGILAIVFGGCFPVSIPLGIIGIQMSRADIPEMDQGIRDPEGKGLTLAGKVCSIIGLVFGGFGVLWTLFYLVLALGLAAAGP